MSEDNPIVEKKKKEINTIVPDQESIILNDQIIDFLAILGFDKDTIDAENGSLNRYTFVYPTSNTNQIKVFLSVCSWLFRVVGKNTDWNAWDDPNTIFSKIIVSIVELNGGKEIDGISLSKLKISQGFGNCVCKVLFYLCKKSLDKVNYTIKKPEHQITDDNDLEMVEETDNEDEATERKEKKKKKKNLTKMKSNFQKSSTVYNNSTTAPIIPNIDEFTWQLEVQNVALKLQKNQSNQNEYGFAAKQKTTEYWKKFYDSNWNSIQNKIENITNDISKSINDIKTKEDELQKQLSTTITGHGKIKSDLKNIQNLIMEKSESLSQLEDIARTETGKFEYAQKKYDEKNSLLTNTEPLMKIKQVCEQLRNEIKELDLRTGVVANTLLHAQLKGGSEGLYSIN